jgi:hypothetical protein
LNLEQWDKIYPGILETDAPPLKSFYRAMDVLWKHRDDVEATLFDRGGQRDLFNQELDVVFYDLTTLHFESTNADPNELAIQNTKTINELAGLYEVYPNQIRDWAGEPRKDGLSVSSEVSKIRRIQLPALT